MFVTISSIIDTATDDLLASGTQDDGVFELRGERTLVVAQRGVGVNNLLVTKVLQGHLILALSDTIQPTTTESESAEVLLDHIQQGL